MTAARSRQSARAPGESDFARLCALVDAAHATHRGGVRGALEAFALGLPRAALVGLGAAAVALLTLGIVVTETEAEAAWARLASLGRSALERGRGSDEPPDADAEAEAPPAPAATAVVELPPPVARAAVAAHARARRGRVYDVQLDPTAQGALRSVGVTFPTEKAPAAEREQALVRGLERLTALLGSPDAALASLRIGRPAVEAALDAARAAGAPEPPTLEALIAHLDEDERRRVKEPVRRTLGLAIGYGMSWPVPESTRVTSGFGMRQHPVLGEPARHTGIDFGVDRGTPIVAVADGRVVHARRDHVNGRFITIDHGHGITSAYVHNSQNLVEVGQRVTRGQTIALSGATGRATGPHLHFQIEHDGRPLDPETFRARRSPRVLRSDPRAEAIGDAQLPR